jgi:transposase
MARIAGHLSVAELEARYRAAQDVTEARHFQAIWLLAQGRTVREVSEVLAFVPRWVGDAAGGALQRLGPRGAGRPAAAQRQGRQPADRRGALRLGRADADAARGWRRVERPQGRRLDGAAPRLGGGASAARLGGAAADRLVAAGAAAAARARGDARAAGRLQGGLEAAVARAKAAHPGRPVEVWAADEHRLGLKPVRRRVWAPMGQRPIALGHHRYQWLHVVAFVQPTSGEAVWYLCSGLSKPFFAELLAAFARQTGAGQKRHIILVLDNAGWHGPEGLAVPEGISLVFLPPYSPELQPAEHLWPLVDEPVANRHFATLADLEAVIAERCRRLDAETVRPHTDFHWWPKPIRPN